MSTHILNNLLEFIEDPPYRCCTKTLLKSCQFPSKRFALTQLEEKLTQQCCAAPIFVPAVRWAVS